MNGLMTEREWRRQAARAKPSRPVCWGAQCVLPAQKRKKLREDRSFSVFLVLLSLSAALAMPVLYVTGQTPAPVAVLYRTPATLGPDRLAAVVGAVTLQPGRPLLVVDAGTCVTYELVDAAGRYVGGNISPGLDMRLSALREHTARLPLVAPMGDIPAMGYDTETAIRAGVVRGIQFEIEGYIRHYREKYPDLFVFLTGGNRLNFDTRLKNCIFADKYLVPRGLDRILEYNDHS